MRRRAHNGVNLSGRGVGPAADPVLSAPMDDQHLFDELLHGTARLGVAVRMEPFETPATQGGLPVYRPGRDPRVDRPARATPVCYQQDGW